VVSPAAGGELFVLVDTADALWPAGGDVVLPLAPTMDCIVNVKDVGGTASTKPIDIQGNGRMIEGVATLPLDVDGACYRLFFDGVAWWVV
jgi:hypothetical protein